MSEKPGDLVPEQKILKIIMVVRGEKIILDCDLAKLYGVETRRLNEQVRRNADKFPEDFMFQLSREEFENLKSQNATSSSTWGGRRKLPLVFTEHGALQAANVLNSPRANKMSVFIVRTFIKLREMALTNEKLSKKFIELEKRVSDHDEVLFELVSTSGLTWGVNLRQTRDKTCDRLTTRLATRLPRPASQIKYRSCRSLKERC